MSRGSWCRISVCTGRNGRMGAGKQGNGMNERSKIQPDPLRRWRKGCLCSDRQQKSVKPVIFLPTRHQICWALRFDASVPLKGNQRLQRLHKMASENKVTPNSDTRDMQKKEKKSWEEKGSSSLNVTNQSQPPPRRPPPPPPESLCQFFWVRRLEITIREFQETEQNHEASY